MHAWRFSASDIKKATDRGYAYSKAIEKAKVRARGCNQGPQKARGVPLSQEELFILCPHGWTYQDTGLRDGEVEGGRGEDGSCIGMADEVGGRDGDGVRWRRVGEVRGQRRKGVRHEK